MPRRDEDDDTYVMGEGKCTQDTEKALLIVIDDKKLWIPKSVVHDDSEVYRTGQEGKVVVKLWWAEKNGHA